MNRPNNHMPQQLIKPWITICNFSLHFIIIKTDVPKIIGMREMPVKMILLPFGSDALFGENWFSAKAKRAACSGLFSTLMNKIDRMGKVPMIFPDVTQSSWPNVYASLDSRLWWSFQVREKSAFSMRLEFALITSGGA